MPTVALSGRNRMSVFDLRQRLADAGHAAELRHVKRIVAAGRPDQEDAP
jgi:hypothetical protein